INVSIPADLSGFGASPPTQWYVSAGPRCRDNNSFPVNPAGASTTAMLTIYESCVEPDGNVNIYAYATRNGEGVAYAALTGVDADATPDTALTAWTPADLATAAVGSNLDTSTFGYLDAHQAIATVPLVATGDDYSRGSLTVARTYNGMPSEVATGGSYTQVTASSNSSEFALQNFTENPRVSQVAVSSPAQATSVVDMSSALPNIREIVLSLPTGLPTLNFVTEQPPDGAQAGAATFIVSDNFVSEPPVAFWIVISGDVSSGSITAPPLSEESLAAILPDDRSLSFLVAVGSLWAFDFQSYSDLINSEGLDPVGLTGLSIFLRSTEGPPIVEADLPARMPRDAAASAARSLWLNRNATFFFEL
ncbi:MAG: hypothetical protein KJO07_01525, partial [Deltaproteobacteria bacterium]|nr:hypothetical protein [Deltaproteobacteria bacterium]